MKEYHTLDHPIKYSALIVCKESRAYRLQRLIDRGANLDPILIISVKDQPHLRNVKNLAAAIPPSIIYIAVDDVDVLFPPEERTVEKCEEFLRELHKRIGRRGLIMVGSRTTADGPLHVTAVKVRREL